MDTKTHQDTSMLSISLELHSPEEGGRFYYYPANHAAVVRTPGAKFLFIGTGRAEVVCIYKEPRRFLGSYLYNPGDIWETVLCLGYLCGSSK